mgnify:CR=1 FL=1
MTPKTENELVDAIAGATAPLHITGGGTRDIGNPVTGDAVSTAALSGISLYEPGALTLVAQAGTPVAEIEAALAAENQRLAFEPMDHRRLLGSTGTPTIGGVVAANVSGPRRIAVGACRDHMLGVRFVDGQGAVLKNGGRVMKNVTGYDLVKLLSGSYGTLGVLSEVSLKVLPKPETSATLRLGGLDISRAVKAMSAALGSPFEVTGAAYSGDVNIRIEGFAASVAYRMEKLKSLLSEFGDELGQFDGADSSVIWQDITDVKRFADAPAVWRISLRPSQAADFISGLAQPEAVDYALDWGGGLIWLATRPEAAAAGIEAIHADVQARAAQFGGHATLIKAPMAARAAVAVFQPENPVVSKLSQGLRARFDPRGILNAGLMA